MSYNAWITVNAYIQYNADLVQITLSTDHSDPNAAVIFDILSGAERLRFWTTPDKTTQVPVPWSGHVENLPKTFYVEGVAWSLAVDDIHLRLRVSTDTTGIKYVTVVQPVINAYYNIQTETPGDSNERNLTPGDTEPIRFFYTLGGIRLRAVLVTVPSSAIGAVTSRQWIAGSGSFYPNYHVDAVPLSGSELDRDEVFWEGSSTFSSLPTDRLVQVSFQMGSVQMQKPVHFRSRVLEPNVVGDDVRMLQDLSNYLGYNPILSNGIFNTIAGNEKASPYTIAGGTTANRVIRFRKANRGTWLSFSPRVEPDEIRNYNYHYDDYRTARNALGWNNGNPVSTQYATISQAGGTVAYIEGLVQAAAPSLDHLPNPSQYHAVQHDTVQSVRNPSRQPLPPFRQPDCRSDVY